MSAGVMEGGGGDGENLLRPPSSSLHLSHPPIRPILFPSPPPPSTPSLCCKLMHPNAPSSLSSLLVLRHFRFWLPPISPPFSPHSSLFPPHCVPSSHCRIPYSVASYLAKLMLSRFPCILSRQLLPSTDLEVLVMSEAWCMRETRKPIRRATPTPPKRID